VLVSPAGSLKILQCNETASLMTGFERGDLMGCPLALIDPKNGDAAQRDSLEQDLLRDHSVRGETSINRHDGSSFPADFSIARVEAGSHVLWMVIYQDITVQKLQQKRIEEARDAAELALSAKNNYLAFLSHEIRNPLSAITGYGDLLNTTSLDEEQADFVSQILGAAQILLAQVNTILDFSKIEAGRLDIVEAEMDLGDCLGAALDSVRPAALAKRISLGLDIAPDVPALALLDGQRLSQVLRNLLSNAVKFTAQGGIRLGLGLGEREGARTLEFSVSDTGIGVAPEHMGRLFTPFQQAEADTSARFGGSGLGLAICRELVELMGGRITAESTPGVGTTMRFFLPLRVADSTGIG